MERNDDELHYQEALKDALCELPPEFQEFVSNLAWERGHAYGYQECLSIALEVASDLKEAFRKYQARMLKS